jgi:hypothetical protein
MTAQQDEPQRRSPGAVRRLIARLHDWWYGAQRPLPIYEFEEVTALMDGWQTHVVRQLAIHEESARRAQSLHRWLGVLAAVFASLAGSSAVVAWQTQTSNGGLAFASALIASAASVLTGVVTFLDLGGRAERHRKATVDYKKALRGLEATSVKPARLDELPAAESDLIEELQTTLANIDASAPIPPRRIAERIARMDVEPRSSVFAGRQDQPRRPGYDD